MIILLISLGLIGAWWLYCHKAYRRGKLWDNWVAIVAILLLGGPILWIIWAIYLQKQRKARA